VTPGGMRNSLGPTRRAGQWLPLIDPRPPAVATMTDTKIHLQGAVLHVDSLDRTIDFYTQLLDLEVVRRTADAAVLVSRAGTSTIALAERRLQHFTDRTVQALMWRIPTQGVLSELERRLERLDAKPARHTLTEDAITLLNARDPDGRRLVFLHHDGETDVPRNIPPEVFLVLSVKMAQASRLQLATWGRDSHPFNNNRRHRPDTATFASFPVVGPVVASTLLSENQRRPRPISRGPARCWPIRGSHP
jgi:catechol 2,3-dioxygenase-like lactoylglutathione lyase family enzyme